MERCSRIDIKSLSIKRLKGFLITSATKNDLHLKYADLGVEDGTVGRDTAGGETVHQLLSEPLVGDNTNGLSIEFLDHLECKLDQIRFSVLASVVEDGIGGILEDLVDELVTESLPDVGGSPEEANRDATLEDGVGAGANAGTCGNKDHPAEHGDNPQDAVGWDTTDPQLGRWIIDNVCSPVTSPRDDERELVPSWLGDGGKGMPFPKRGVGDTDRSTGVRASCIPIMSVS